MLALIVASLGSFFLLAVYWQRKERDRLHNIANESMQQAENRAKILLEKAALDAKNITFDAQRLSFQMQDDLEKLKRELNAKDDQLSREKQKMVARQQELKAKEQQLFLREKELEEKLSLSIDAIRKEAILKAQKEAERECQLAFLQKSREQEVRSEAAGHSLIVQVLSRLPKKALKDASETVITLPNEEMKAKIIGREGKNIKAFQNLTGVTLVIDEAQGLTVVLSSFDPERREIAKIALQELVRVGTINPGRIEEEVKHAESSLDKALLEYGKEAANLLSIRGLDPVILLHIGKMKLRSSYGQNLLEHSIEVAQILAMIAKELKLSSEKAMRMGLLHDIGKVVTADTPLSHAILGYKLLLEHGESEEVANGVGAHHDEMAPLTQEAMLVKCADYLSGARKGSRAETDESFFKRLQTFEAEAMSFNGVKSAFALSAGRELQVFVRPEVVDDLEAIQLARDIAKKIQPFAGNQRVQISVIREMKAVEYSV